MGTVGLARAEVIFRVSSLISRAMRSSFSIPCAVTFTIRIPMSRKGGIDILCYAFEEVFAEKIRALAERQRPRDLYDVIHLCVELGYQGTTRFIEPYSLRRTKANDLLLYAVRSDNSEIRAYRVDRIESAAVTRRTFVPRFAVELTAAGPIVAPSASRGEARARLVLPRAQKTPRAAPHSISSAERCCIRAHQIHL